VQQCPEHPDGAVDWHVEVTPDVAE